MRILALLAFTALAACGSPNDPGVGGVTRSEAEALNDAAEMLDVNTTMPLKDEPPAEPKAR